MTRGHQPDPSRELPEAHRPRAHGSFDATLITFAAMGLFDGLTADQRARVLLAYEDPSRTHWNFLPESGRHGLPLGELDRGQEVRAHRLIAESMSIPAYARVVQVMANEHVLRELNQPVFGHIAPTFRDARGYFLTFFGQPQPDTTWGWRLVGHHLSINVTVVDGDLVSATPFLLGAEPAHFGPFRILGEEEDAAFVLLDSLTGSQQHQAIIHPRPPADFVTRTVATIGEVEYPAYHGIGRRDAMITDEDRKALAYFRAHPRGIRAGDISATQRRHFDDLLARFVERARPGLVGFEMDRIAAAGGVEELHFAWAGGTSTDQPHYFRIQGPATLIEFDNAEDNANHVHSVWRDPSNDFGDDLLIQHHLEHTHTSSRADDAS
ncbi:MAG: DUF3500 domain-containing protein [Candidatus Dormibacteraeota bacterium]|uniref:DUF3500 domain-containing protein n=1 Tax=Candidatus Dormiibacter inghamiae TaxID=3127013 RepID=A0A934K8C3_9BACT|nr:DUF3500 domain-containing protein [Candidatus Dormibacteraeota bacterium]MBJ7605560.1 DUF3500 domain-containing protein [Candidatus Dormibacteraeota bacterium]